MGMEKVSVRVTFLFLIALMVFLGVTINCSVAEVIAFKGKSIAVALQQLGSKYHVTIVVDPSVRGMVNGKVDTDLPLEAALIKVLDPFGYSFARVDDYYVVNGKDSPLTVFVDWQSYKIPVGFIAPQLQAKLAEYAPYLKYDFNLGILFLKAPSSKVNEILEKLWAISAASSQTTVVYSLRIIDLINSGSVDRLWEEVAHVDSQPTGGDIVITPGKLQVKRDWDAIFSMVDTNKKELTDRQPWLAILPGKTSRFTSVGHYIGDEPEDDQRFSLKITPISVDSANGEVMTRVELDGDENRKHSVSTTIKIRPEAPEPLAVVRRTGSKQTRRWFGWFRTEEVRHYALILTAIPLNIQQYFVNDLNVMQIADLGAINKLSDSESGSRVSTQVKDSKTVEFLLGINGKTDHVDPWFNFNYPLTDTANLSINYENPELYELAFSWLASDFSGAELELRAGEGNGPDQLSSLMFGVSDQTKPVNKITFFAGYYLAYLLDEKELSDSGFWELGACFGDEPFQMLVSTHGGPEIDGSKIRLHFDIQKQTWVFGVDELDGQRYYKLGVKFNF